jgi:K+/H+ antiporter YhaU regulatory subunit KhtT
MSAWLTAEGAMMKVKQMVVRETALPGVGWRYDLADRGNPRLSVICQMNGRCSLVVYDDPVDPDAGRELVSLTREEAAALTGFLAARTCSGPLPSARRAG